MLVMNIQPIRVNFEITNNLSRRIFEHKNKIKPRSFTAKYNVDKLVYFEMFENVYEAISREKQIKGWLRRKKLQLIRSINSGFNDLYHQF